ncbi:RHS repeat protein [Gynuella sunshinyii]|uniref:RHS repeat protein n=1 Tax=Gynuella sunshinyii TaxID=1445505 RepID=UPI00146FD81B|nr:RHS repeat protein [Gynuella sunshinyii]
MTSISPDLTVYTINGHPTRYNVSVTHTLAHPTTDDPTVVTEEPDATAINVYYDCKYGVAYSEDWEGLERELTCVDNPAPPLMCTPKRGNPVEVQTGKKYEAELDYVSPNGLLTIQREYKGQDKGWVIEDLPSIYTSSDNVSHDTGIFFEKIYIPNNKQFYFSATVNASLYDLSTSGNVFNTYYQFLESVKVPYHDFENEKTIDLGNSRYQLVKTDGVYRPSEIASPIVSLKTGSNEENQSIWVLTLKNGHKQFFNNRGLIVKDVFPSLGKNFVIYEYGSHLQLLKKTDSTGRSLIYNYDNTGRFTSITLPDGGTILYEFASIHDQRVLTAVQWPDGRRVRYTYNEEDYYSGPNNYFALTGKFDTNDTRIGTYTYQSGKAVTTERAGGVDKWAFVRNASLVTLTNANNFSTRQYYKTVNGVYQYYKDYIPATDINAAKSNLLSYDNDGLIIQSQDFAGNKTQFDYDDSGQRTARVEGIASSVSGSYASSTISLPDGARKTSTERFDDGRIRRVVQPGLFVTYLYDGDADPLTGINVHCDESASTSIVSRLCTIRQQATLDNNGEQGFDAQIDARYKPRETNYYYNAQGRLVHQTGRQTLTYQYYDNGDIQYVRDANDQVLVHYLDYDAGGRIKSLEDANGAVTQYSYNAMGKVSAIQNDSGVYSISYDDNGLVSAVSPLSGTVINYHYDNAQRMTDIEDSFGNRIHYDLDLMGNVLSTQIHDASGTLVRQHQQAFDELSRLRQSIGGTDQQTTQYGYDANDNNTRITDPKQNPDTTQQFDALNRLTQITDSAGGITYFSYDSQDRITSVTDPRGLVTRYQYNGFGDLATLTSPDTGTTTFAYDDAGNLIQKTDAHGTVTQYTYDALNRLTGIHYPANSEEDISYRYDETGQNNAGIGRLTSLSQSHLEQHYSYNSVGQITQVLSRLHDQNISAITQYRYNAQGQLTRLTYPTGTVLNYEYNDQGQLQHITWQANQSVAAQPLIRDLTYLPFGPATGFTYGNGIQQSYTYDLDYRLTDLSSRIQDWAYHTTSTATSNKSRTSPTVPWIRASATMA